MAKLDKNSMFDVTRTMGITSKVTFDENDNPKTIQVNIDMLRETLKMIDVLEVDSIYLTIVDEKFPLILKPDVEKDMAFVVTPRLS